MRLGRDVVLNIIIYHQSPHIVYVILVNVAAIAYNFSPKLYAEATSHLSSCFASLVCKIHLPTLSMPFSYPFYANVIIALGRDGGGQENVAVYCKYSRSPHHEKQSVLCMSSSLIRHRRSTIKATVLLCPVSAAVTTN